MYHAEKEKQKEEAAQQRGSVLGLPLDVARARVRMGREAAEALDAEAIEWLCGPGGLRGSDWLLTKAKKPGQTVFDREPSVLEALMAAAIKAQEKPSEKERAAAMESALRIVRSLAGAGFSFQAEAEDAGKLCALDRLAGLAFPTALPNVRLATPMERHQGKPEVSVEARHLSQLQNVPLLAELGACAVLEMSRSKKAIESGMARLGQAIESAARRNHVSEAAMGANPLFAAARQAMSDWAKKELLGDEVGAGENAEKKARPPKRV